VSPAHVQIARCRLTVIGAGSRICADYRPIQGSGLMKTRKVIILICLRLFSLSSESFAQSEVNTRLEITKQKQETVSR